MIEDWLDNPSEDQEEMNACLHRFERMMAGKARAFFDEDEYLFLIDHYMMHEQYGMAGEALRLASERYPDHYAIRLRHIGLLCCEEKYQEAYQKLKGLERLQPVKDGFNLYETAVLYMDMSQWKDADRLFRAITALPKEELNEVMNDPEFHNDLSETHAHMHRLPQALDAKIEAIRRGNAPVSDLDSLMEILVPYDALEQVLRHFAEKTESDPLSHLDWQCYGKALIEAGRFEEARRALENVQAICGDRCDAATDLAAIEALNGNLPACERMLAQHFMDNGVGADEQACIYFRIAHSAHTRLQYGIAVPFYQKVIDINPDDDESRYMMAVALSEQGEYYAALEELERLRQHTPDYMDAVTLGADILVRLGRSGEAVEMLEEAVAKEPQATMLYRLAQLLFSTGEPKQGRTCLELAFQQDPGGLWNFMHSDNSLADNPEIIDFLNKTIY
ncbi:MAG: tetratricopeptide repeat protein [Bacteroidales bacterium]|nr:tetratricopeptide repeat protein [Bacteroidales bacterium]